MAKGKKSFTGKLEEVRDNTPAKAAKIVENVANIHGANKTAPITTPDKSNAELQAQLDKLQSELEKAKEKLKYRRGRTLELYARKTYLVRKDLVSRIEDVARFTERSLKDVVEEALEIVVEKYKDAPVLPDYMRKGKKNK